MANRKSRIAGTLVVDGVEYVVIPKADYERVKATRSAPDLVDARAFVRDSIAADLRGAREQAGLTQAQLAGKMGKSQTMVSQAESGTARVSERYVHAVLEACGLPGSWGGHGARHSIARKKSA